MDRDFQVELWQSCAQSLLFYVNAFCWTFDPRQENDKKLPFITWDYQDEAFLALNDSIGKHDVLVEKSRDMGASWICLTVFQWRWMFKEYESFLMVSRKEGLVDGDGDSLFSHLDFIMSGLPSWMRPRVKRLKLKYYNLERNTKIEGESTTGNVGVGGRRTAMLLDEFGKFDQGGWEVLGATADNTNTRLFNSTPQGTANAFYAQRESGTPRLRFHWSQHPTKGAGLYRHDAEGNLIVEDRNFQYPLGFEFNPDNPTGEEGWRSPWYDRECKRRAHEVEIATQLDIDYQGSDYPYFDPGTLRELMDEFCMAPFHVGTLHVEGEYDPRWEEDDVGRLKIWCHLDEDGKPPGDRDYVIGVDVSQGTKASDSVLSVGDRLSGEKVAEWADNQTSTNRLAEVAVALCKMFSGPGDRGAFLIWEATGPGRTFGKMIVDEIMYSNIYYRRDETRLSKKETDKPGWFSTGDGKKDLLATYREALFSREFINPSKRALEEAGEYVYLPNGRIEHGGSARSPDPTNRGTGHGDRVIADALCAKIIHEKRQKVDKLKPVTPVLSLAWRRGNREVVDEWT